MVKFVHERAFLRNRIVYLAAFFPENAGYHYRTFLWAVDLRRRGADVKIRSAFRTKAHFDRVLREERVVQLHTVFLFSRLWHCLSALAYGTVIVRRELLLFNDYGGLFLDRFLLALHPNVILDIDDDISAAKKEPRPISLYGRVLLESPRKFGDSLRLYSRFIAGSAYLEAFIRARNPAPEHIVVIPTCVDYLRHSAKTYSSKQETVDFGWIGGDYNYYLLDILMPHLERLAAKYEIRLRVISGAEYRPAAGFEIVNVPWSLAGEVDELRKVDVGLMPLYDTPVERGKCGFKLLQYMGLGIVSVASAITINQEIVDDGIDGFLVRDEDEWESVLESVIRRREEWPGIGEAARRKVAEAYTFEANAERYASFLQSTGWSGSGRLGRALKPVVRV